MTTSESRAPGTAPTPDTTAPAGNPAAPAPRAATAATPDSARPTGMGERGAGWGFATRAVHTGERSVPGRAVPTTTPIYMAASYSYPTTGELDAVFAGDEPGYVYVRYANPTTAALEQALASLEGTEAAVVVGSGMGALHAAILAAGVSAGDGIVAARDLYGATVTLLGNVFGSLGVRTHFVDITDLAAVEAALAAYRPRLLLCETISNPLLRVADLPRLAELAHAHGAVLAVDSTFASPFLARPAAWGADLVIHSATKYLSGHGDVMAGAVCASAELGATVRELVKATGGVISPFDSWLVLRGLKTLPLRLERQCASAATIAAWLAEHPCVAGVNYPGLPGHPQHALAARLLGGRFGAMISFELRGGNRERIFRLFEALRLCVPATTLGDVYSLVLYPAMSSHRGLSPAQRAAVGISDALVRLSVGIEDVADIIADLDGALRAAAG